MNKLDRSIHRARRRTGLETRIGYLGDTTGEPRDYRTPGNLWVRFQTAAGFTQPVSYPVEPNANIPIVEGQAVEVGFSSGKECILRANVEGTREAGRSPLALNPLDDAAHAVKPAKLLAPFYFCRHADTVNEPLTVSVFPHTLLISGTLQNAGAASIQLDNPAGDGGIPSLVPGAGLHCWVVVFWDTVNESLSAFASTPVDMGTDTLTFATLQECVDQAETTDIPICAVYLADDQTALDDNEAHWKDLRQFINVPGEGGGGTGFTLAADTGTPATIGDSDTATIAGGTAIATSVAGQTVTISVVTEALQDMIAAFLLEGANIDLTYDDTGNTLTIAVTGLDSGDISDFSEAVDDRVNALLVEGTGIDLAYNDGANTLTIAVSSITASQVSDFAEAVDDRIAALMVAGTGISLTYDDTANTFTVAVSGLTAANISGFNESVDDRVAALTVAGTGISLTYDDTANTLTVAVSGLTASNISGFDESVDDRVASLLVAGSGISITYNDGANTLTIASTVTPVTSVTATAPLASSGGTTPAISVDNAVVALRQHVVAASTANVTKSSAPATLDGVTLVSGDRILLKNQTTGSENGLWIFNGSGSALTRTTDYAAGSTTVAFAGVAVMVLGGTTNKGTVYYITTTGTITIDTTSTSWSAYNFAGGQVSGNLDVSTMRDVLNNLVVEVVDVSSDYTTNGTSFADIDATHLQVTKVTGSTALVGFAGSVVASGAANINFNIKVNGVDYFANDGFIAINPGSNETNASFVVPITGLTPGSNQFRLRWKVSTGSVTATMRAGAGASGGRDIHPNLWVQ